MKRHPAFESLPGEHLVAREHVLAPTTGAGKLSAGIRRVLIGRPLATEQQIHERLTKVKGLAVLSSDALSSVAYATEETLLILVLAGTGAVRFSLPIAGAIILLLAIVGASYRQTIAAYPNGGGSYIVSKDNLGAMPWGLIAAAALLVDYVLTVSVSIAAGVAALTSAFPNLTPYTVEFGVLFIAIIMIGNLRGIRESGNIFALPTYIFIFSIVALIIVGLAKLALGIDMPKEPPTIAPVEGLGIFLILRAFASGCTALTGVEAISNGVPAFKPPESKNARATLTWMVVILGVMFAGITILAHQLGIVPNDQETVVSQIARTVFGTGAMYFVIQMATMLILVLAANTSFADFPRLSSILARDGFMPHQFAHRGERLAFSNGIIALAVFSTILLVAFGGETDALIPLYAVGVFTAFTLSQAGMVVHHARVRQPGWRTARVINGVGAIATAVVTIIIAATKFIYGAWIVLVIVPIFIAIMAAIHKHYAYVSRVTHEYDPVAVKPRKIIVMPVAKLDAVAERTLNFARSMCGPGDELIAVHVTLDVDESELADRWAKEDRDVRLVCIESPYRALTRPLLAFIDALSDTDPDAFVTVVLPEFVPQHWYEHLLHNHSALALKAALLFRPRTVVVSVPYIPHDQLTPAGRVFGGR
ncbi:MAG TPA: APC family permease [Chloroflexota bacterium]|nr:APC family permease [Chloroflexota bacterium]